MNLSPLLFVSSSFSLSRPLSFLLPLPPPHLLSIAKLYPIEDLEALSIQFAITFLGFFFFFFFFFSFCLFVFLSFFLSVRKKNRFFFFVKIFCPSPPSHPLLPPPPPFPPSPLQNREFVTEELAISLRQVVLYLLETKLSLCIYDAPKEEEGEGEEEEGGGGGRGEEGGGGRMR